MPAHHPGRTRHELEPQTGLHHRRRRSSSAAGPLRAVEVAGLSRTTHTAEIIRPSTAASQMARASRAPATGQRLPFNAPHAFIRPQRTRRNRQISIGQNLRSASRGFVPWRLSDAGPGASDCVCDSRHPKPFTRPDLRLWPFPSLYSCLLADRSRSGCREWSHVGPQDQSRSNRPGAGWPHQTLELFLRQ